MLFSNPWKQDDPAPMHFSKHWKNEQSTSATLDLILKKTDCFQQYRNAQETT